MRIQHNDKDAASAVYTQGRATTNETPVRRTEYTNVFHIPFKKSALWDFAWSAPHIGAVLTVLPDCSKTSVRQFLETIPPRLRPTLHTVCTDMWDGYVKAVQEFAADHPDVVIQTVVDRFHVTKNYRDYVDKVRKQEYRRLKKVLAPTDYAKIVQGTPWLVRQNHKDLSPDDTLFQRLYLDLEGYRRFA